MKKLTKAILIIISTILLVGIVMSVVYFCVPKFKKTVDEKIFKKEQEQEAQADNELSDRLKEMQAHYDEVVKERDSLKKELESQKENYSQILAKFNECQIKASQLETQVARLESDIKLKEKEIEAAGNSSNSLREEKGKLEGELEALKTQLLKEQEKMQTLSEELQTKSESISDLSSQVDNLQKQIDGDPSKLYFKNLKIYSATFSPYMFDEEHEFVWVNKELTDMADLYLLDKNDWSLEPLSTTTSPFYDGVDKLDDNRLFCEGQYLYIFYKDTKTFKQISDFNESRFRLESGNYLLGNFGTIDCKLKYFDVAKDQIQNIMLNGYYMAAEKLIELSSGNVYFNGGKYYQDFDGLYKFNEAEKIVTKIGDTKFYYSSGQDMRTYLGFYKKDNVIYFSADGQLSKLDLAADTVSKVGTQDGGYAHPLILGDRYFVAYSDSYPNKIFVYDIQDEQEHEIEYSGECYMLSSMFRPSDGGSWCYEYDGYFTTGIYTNGYITRLSSDYQYVISDGQNSLKLDLQAFTLTDLKWSE